MTSASSVQFADANVSINQSTYGYDEAGIFLGVIDGENPGSLVERFSIKDANDDNFLKWDGSALSIKGDLNIAQPYYSYSAQSDGEVKATNLSTNLSPYSADHTTYFPIRITTGTINAAQTTQE